VSYDEKCEEMARYFLDDYAPFTEEQVKELAGDIQAAIEDFIGERLEA
jgi:hypothetical protein